MINGSQKSMQPNNRYTLLTGATGLVGQYLMRDLLLAGERLAVVVRDSKQAKGFERIDDILKFWEDELQMQLPRPVVLTGCITAKHCGLSSQELAWLRANCGRVLHNAAVLTFEGPDRSREPWVTNVGGTQNILNLCREVGITDLHYVSTAYVCGEQSGVVMESQLDVGQDFRNDYERSKFEAEKLVRDCAWIEPPTTYRPAVISGDSRTGYTSSYHGLYLYLRLMATLVPRQPVDEDGYRHTPIRLPMSGSEPRNVVPVEWVSAVMCRLLNREDARGKTFHLAPESGITARRVVEYCYTYFHSKGVVYCGELEGADEPMSAFEDEFLKSIRLYRGYDRSDPLFDRTNLHRFAGDLPCPVISEEVMHRYLKFGEWDRWGKGRKKKRKNLVDDVRSPQERMDQIRNVLQATSSQPSLLRPRGNSIKGPFQIGIDIQGPGGGQWRLTEAEDGSLNVGIGLPLDPKAAIVRISVSELEKKVEEIGGPLTQFFRNLDPKTDEQWCGEVLSRLRPSFAAVVS